MTIESVRRVTIRMPKQLHRALSRVAAASDVSLNQLAREAFEEYLNSQAAQGKFPLEELSQLLAPSARARNLRELDVAERVKESRRRIWKERYQPALEQVRKTSSAHSRRVRV